MDVARRCAAEAAARHLPVNGRCRFSGRAESRVHSRTWWPALATVVLLAVGPLERLSALQCADGSAPPCQASVVRPAPPRNSVAVLYFDNLSRDTADTYLADGLSEEIIAELGRISRLTVKSRGAVLRYRGAADLVNAGRALRVAHVVNGSLRHAGRRLRVNVELMRVPSGDRLWGTVYDRDAADLFSIQRDVAIAVATAIAGHLLPGERTSLTRQPTRDGDAYDHFVKGNYYLAKRNARTALRAIDEYRAATGLDSSFTPAFARIALAYALSLDWGWFSIALPAESLLTRAIAASDRALRQDSSSSDAWMARGYVLLERDQKTLAGALRAFERAIALDPRNAEAVHQYGDALWAVGLDSAAGDAYQRALDLDPERAITLYRFAVLRMRQGEYNGALRLLDSTVSVDPGFASAYATRAQYEWSLGQTGKARRDAEVAVRLGAGSDGEAVLAAVDAKDGDTLSGRARIDTLLRGPIDSLHPDVLEGYSVGWALVVLNEGARAIDLLERVRPRGWALWARLQSPRFDPIRADPRFQRLLEDARPAEARR